MSRKTTVAYAHIFNYIENNIITLRCHSMMTDYEVAFRKALRELHTDIVLNGCWFHFCQAIRRKAMTIKVLSALLRTGDVTTKKLFFKFMALPLLPANKIEEGFQLLKIETAEIPEFQEFVDYFDKQWMQKVL